MPKTNAIQKAQEISESLLGDIDRHIQALEGGWHGDVLHSQVVCMTYIDTAITAGGIIRPPSATQEDRFQGKVFLILAMGPGAFKDDKIAQFHNWKPLLHTWCMARPSDGTEFFFRGNTLRLFEDVDIRVINVNPHDIW